jgi:collagenase-like PrtC family protease
LLGLLSRLYPQVEIHASTQLATHNSRQIEVLSALGVTSSIFPGNCPWMRSTCSPDTAGSRT